MLVKELVALLQSQDPNQRVLLVTYGDEVYEEVGSVSHPAKRWVGLHRTRGTVASQRSTDGEKAEAQRPYPVKGATAQIRGTASRRKDQARSLRTMESCGWR